MAHAPPPCGEGDGGGGVGAEPEEGAPTPGPSPRGGGESTSRMGNASPASSQNSSRRSRSRSASRRSSFTGPQISGTSSRPVCSEASMAMERRRSSRTWSALVRSVCTSRTRRTPSSAAFSTMVSSRPRLTSAITRSRSGPRCCGRVCDSPVRVTTRLLTADTVACHSPSRPLNTATMSPTDWRMTADR